MSEMYFTADLHLGHQFIITYCNRPLPTYQEMDELIIKNWNDVVKPTDRIYIAGDLAFRTPVEYLKRLNGQKHFIIGNHDNVNQAFTEQFESIGHIKKVKNPLMKNNIILCHYAMRVWEGSYEGNWHLFGHSHGMMPQANNHSFDIGVDCWDFKPVSIEEVCEHIIKLDNIGR